MNTRISHRGALGGFAAAVIATGLVILLPASAQAAPSLGVVATDADIGQAIHATAELSESPNAAGEISFALFGPGDADCSGPELTPAPASVAVSGEGQYDSGDFTPATAGTYRWSAHYSGDSENPEADSPCSATSTVDKASPNLTGNASDALVGGAIHDQATLSGGFAATGQLVFRAYGPGDATCANAPAYEETVAVSGEDSYAPTGFAPSPGTYRWTVEYGGDANNEATGTTCDAANQTSVVSKASPDLSGVATASAPVGLTITDNATLSGGFAPTGQLVFRAYGPDDASCADSPAYEKAVAISGNDSYSPAGFAPPPGLYRWTVGYAGDANNTATSTTCGALSQTSSVSKASPSLAGVATSAAVVGLTITDSATLSGGFAATGQLVFRAYGPGDATCANAPAYEETVPVNGAGSYAPAGFTPSPGTYRWTVKYEGDANNAATSTSCGAANQTSTVSKASPGLAGLASSAVVGLTITDSATLSGGFAPTGQLVFRAYGPDDASCADSPAYEKAVAISGNDSYSPAGFAPPPGLYRWTVDYAGDANNTATGTTCDAANQTSVVSKASPSLSGVATSAAVVGLSITDNANLSGGFAASGHLVFRAYGPGDATCASPPAYQEAVPISGAGSYAPAGFAPPPGLYRWTVEYAGDANNDATGMTCGAANQSSAVGTIDVTLTASASGSTVGQPVTATATIENGAIPAGQVTFKAFPPSDASCSGPPAFSSAVAVSGNGSYRSTFVPTRVGTYRWAIAYSGDVNHAPATAGCGKATSTIAKAKPTIAGKVTQRLTVGTFFRDTATLQGGYEAGGTITFRIYGPVAAGCAKPVFVNTVAVSGNGTFSSDPFVAQRPGRYSFVASYSGDAENQAVTEPCDSAGQVALVQKRAPKVKPRARLIGGRLISIRAHLSGGASPSGLVNFRLFGPGNKRCKGKPAFSGGITVNANGSYSLAKYLATKPGTYRLEVGYSGDQRNQRYKGECSGAQPIRVG